MLAYSTEGYAQLTLLESIKAEERDDGTISVSYIGLSVAPTIAK